MVMVENCQARHALGDVTCRCLIPKILDLTQSGQALEFYNHDLEPHFPERN